MGVRPRLRVATYNIHGGVGRGGRVDLGRTLGVLAELDCDLVALQEVASAQAVSGKAGTTQLDALAAGTALTGIAGPTLIRHDGPYGNALLTRLPVRDVRRIDLSVPGREPRGALVVRLDWGGTELTVAATHLGLRPAERRRQVRSLLGSIPQDPHGVSLLMGDINEWLLAGRPLRWLHARFGRPPAPASFPAAFPLLALDRIWVHPCQVMRRLWAQDTQLARNASDHLPVVAELERPTS